MKKSTGFVFDIQGKSNTELLRMMHQVKVENAKYSKESSHVNTIGGNLQNIYHQKKALGTGNMIQIPFKKPHQLKQSLEVEASKKIVESRKGFCQNNNLKKKSMSTVDPEVKGSIESHASKKTDVQNKEVRRDNTIKRQEKPTLRNQVKGSTESHASKKFDEQNKEVRQDNTLKRQGKSTMGNQVQGSTVDKQASKRQKTIPKCPALPLTEYLKMRKEQHGVEEADDEDIEENEMDEDMETDINYESGEIEGADVNEAKVKKRGKTLCKNIHARDFKDRPQITLNEEGQPIGPNDETMAELSSFLGIVAKSVDLCPLTFNNWKALVKSWSDKKIDPVWEYVNERYIVPEKGKKVVFAIVNDAWRRYKHFLKTNHFSNYKTMRERLKNRPDEVPEDDFRKLMVYWSDENSQEVSQQNAQNITQLKWRHRTGNKGFVVIREKMRVSNEDNEPPNQAEMFIATRQSKKGKELDQETNNTIIKLQDLIEKHGKPSPEAFQRVCGKEKPGRLRCHGRTTTPTLLKRNEEIAKLKREHSDEVKQLKDQIQEMEEKRRKEADAMEGKIQYLLKAMLSQNTTRVDTDALTSLITSPATDPNNVLRSSTSTNTPNDDIDEEFEDLETSDGDIDVN